MRDWRRVTRRPFRLPDRNPELPGLVGEVVLDVGARGVEDAQGQGVEQGVVALKRRGVPVAAPVGLEVQARVSKFIATSMIDAKGLVDIFGGDEL